MKIRASMIEKFPKLTNFDAMIIRGNARINTLTAGYRARRSASRTAVTPLGSCEAIGSIYIQKRGVILHFKLCPGFFVVFQWREQLLRLSANNVTLWIRTICRVYLFKYGRAVDPSVIRDFTILNTALFTAVDIFMRIWRKRESEREREKGEKTNVATYREQLPFVVSSLSVFDD